MKRPQWLTPRTLILLSVLLVVGLSVAAYFLFRRPPRVEMARYVPATALAFVKIDSLSDIVEGLTDTTAWRELGPALGVSSQLNDIGLAGDLIGRVGLGPSEAVAAGRAQLLLVLTGLEASTGPASIDPKPAQNPEAPASDQGESLTVDLNPQFALVIETHVGETSAAELAVKRGPLLAQRIYGDGSVDDEEDYYGSRIMIFRGERRDRQLVVASTASLVLIGNHVSAIKSCVDTIAGRTSNITADETYLRFIPDIGEDLAILGYVTRTGVQNLVRFGAALLSTRVTSDPERIGSLGDLVGHLSDQAVEGLAYGAAFEDGGVRERYLTILRDHVADGLAEPLKPAAGISTGSLNMIPRDVEDVTLLNVARAGEMPQRLLKQLVPRVDIVAALALREFVDSLYKQFAVDPAIAAEAIGDEGALVRFSSEEPTAVILRVLKRDDLEKQVNGYLSRDGATMSRREFQGNEILSSSHQDGRAAAFVGDYLVLATVVHIERILSARTSENGVVKDPRLSKALSTRPPGVSFISFKPRSTEAAEMMLSISKLTRVTDGSAELLETPEVKSALERIPPSVSFTGFRQYGIYTESHSAVGSFGLLLSTL